MLQIRRIANIRCATRASLPTHLKTNPSASTDGFGEADSSAYQSGGDLGHRAFDFTTLTVTVVHCVQPIMAIRVSGRMDSYACAQLWSQVEAND
jgi:hypothetical protein